MREPASDGPTIAEMVEALYVYTEPLLNTRYHAMLLRRSIRGGRADLSRIPGLLIESARLSAEGAQAWAGTRQGAVKEGDFVDWAEHAILDAFLTLVEAQLSVISHLARQAPTAAVRGPFDKMAASHREIASTLREALKALEYPAPALAPGRRSVQEEDPEGDFRGQLEAAVRHAREAGTGVRRVILSATALRHLRDQGLFQEGVSRFHGLPVAIDLGWDTAAFALETYDRVPLEEIIGGTRDPSAGATDRRS